MSKSLKKYIEEIPVRTPAPIEKADVVPTDVTESKTANLQTYIKTVSEKIQKEVEVEKPTLVIAEKAEPITEAVVEEANEVLTEDYTPIIRESIEQLTSFLAEQKNTQIELGKMVAGLIKTVNLQNKLIESRFEQMDTILSETSKLLAETTNKLTELEIREINIPAPVVNVMMTEQKKIIKTVDRDSNGLISKITEETEQSVTQDK